MIGYYIKNKGVDQDINIFFEVAFLINKFYDISQNNIKAVKL